MSTLGQIAVQALKPAAALLGPNGQASTLVIGDDGAAWQGTVDEERTTRDYMDGGQQVEIEQNFVGATDEFLVRYPESSQSYEGKTATVDGKSRTVAEIEARRKKEGIGKVKGRVRY